MAEAVGPDPFDVGALYDQFDTMDVLHFGYWENAEDRTPIGAAADRLTDLVSGRLGPVGAGSSLLDVGCGIGTPALRVARTTGARVTGVTVSAKQVQQARAAVPGELAGRVRFELVNAMDMPFADGSFDSAYALESVIHMDRVKALTEIGRVVRPGGRIVLTDVYERIPARPGRPSLMHVLAGAWKMSPLIGRNDYPGLARAAGLRLVEVGDVSEQVLWRTLRMIAEQIRAREKPLVPEQIVDQVGAGRAGGPDLAALLEDAEELGCLLVVLARD